MEERKIYPDELEDDDYFKGAGQEGENIIAHDENSEDEKNNEPMQDTQINANKPENNENESPPSEDERDIENINDMLQEDPRNVQLYQQIIEHYKSLGRLEMVQKTRQQALDNTTLTLDMWKDWIEDSKLEASTFRERIKVCEIFDQAMETFNYFEIAKEYGEYILNLYADPENEGSIGQNEVKKVFDKILRVWLLDFSHSTEIWQLYLQFENDLLNNVKSEDEKSKLIKNIRGLYRQKLTFPTIDLDLIWEEYQTWEQDENEKQEIEKRYNKTSEKIPLFIKFEDNLTSILKEFETITHSIDEKLINYFREELPKIAGDNFNYFELYIEKILAKYPDRENLWDFYIESAEQCKNGQQRYRVFERACKNCPQNVDFKIALLRENEKSGATVEKYKEVVQKFIEEMSGNVQLEHILRKELCEFYARHISPELTPVLENSYQDSITHIFPYNKGLAETLLLHWAEIETYKLKNKPKVVELMETYISDNGSSAVSWLNYIKFMRFFDDLKYVRTLCKRGLEYCEDSETLGNAWLEWEKKFGTIETIMECEKKIKKKLKRQHEVQAKIQAEEEKMQQVRNKRKYSKEDMDSNYKKSDESNEKRRPAPLSQRHTLFIKGIPEDTVEDELETFFNTKVEGINVLAVRIVRDDKGNSRGIAYLDVETDEMAHKALTLDNAEFKNTKIEVHISAPPSEKSKDENTIFVKELSMETNREDLKNFFEKCGKVQDVRLITDSRTNKSKGFGYIEFENKEGAMEALKLNKTQLKGKTITVLKYESDKKKRDNLGNTIHITNIAFDANEQDLIQHFEKYCGQNVIRKCHLVKDNVGNSRGYAFIEFEQEDAMNKALMLKEKIIKGRPVVIKRSTRRITEEKPERREEKHSYQEKSHYHHHHDSENRHQDSEKPSKNYREMRERKAEWKHRPKKISLETTPKLDKNEPVPKEEKKPEIKKEQNTEKSENMTNDDFRKMLFG